MDHFSFLGNSDPQAIESLYQQYLSDPQSVNPAYRDFFSGFDFARQAYADTSGTQVNKEFRVMELINAYRQRGHLFTQTNPVRARRSYQPTLDIENFGLTPADLSRPFHAGKELGLGVAPLTAIIAHLQQTYCKSIGAEYLYIRKPEVVNWLREKMESIQNTPSFSAEKKRNIYHQLKQAAGLEAFIHKKFVGQKRFSLEGSEVVIPGLRALIEKAANLGAGHVVMGMAHRGRLNVLNNILGKPCEYILKEFEGDDYANGLSLGDVKYHLGYENQTQTPEGGQINLMLVPNPSHLEAVLPVLQGVARARIDSDYGGDADKVVPVAIHGDAAIAAQGVVYEVVQMAQLPGYHTGGTIHVVINNQIGFTTNYLEARSSTYCTDVAKVTRCPVFHVNGDDAEAMVYVMELAMEYRHRFHTDVFVDVLSYRKHGHNEGDEPRFTQPTLYKAIASHPNVRDIYAQHLMQQGLLTPAEHHQAMEAYDQHLESRYEIARSFPHVVIHPFNAGSTQRFRYATQADFEENLPTAIPEDMLQDLAQKVNQLPVEKPFFKKVHKIINDRLQLIANNQCDWAMAEQLAFASLLTQGYPVRLSGQDAQRGTFAHRHAAFTVEDTDEKFIPLQHLDATQAPFTVYNSLLSEYGVLGFEYGHALAAPKGLTLWEAQFGDFSNVAQVVIDQYLSSAEEKWGLQNGLVLLLPHGYEGQGPEHSSARLERFLSLAANGNLQIVNPTTPANFFHLLRRQVMRDIRIPLVVFTPKSLLRHPLCLSPLEAFTNGAFQPIIDDADVLAPSVTRVIFCTGKIYYDLLARKQALNASDVAIIRIEQLHPFPLNAFINTVAQYPNALLHLWVQEEPQNMGAWEYLRSQNLPVELIPIARLVSASPATGLNRLHQKGQDEIINKVFKPCHCDKRLKYCGLQCMEGKTREEILQQHLYFTEPSRFSI